MQRLQRSPSPIYTTLSSTHTGACLHLTTRKKYGVVILRTSQLNATTALRRHHEHYKELIFISTHYQALSQILTNVIHPPGLSVMNHGTLDKQIVVLQCTHQSRFRTDASHKPYRLHIIADANVNNQ